MISYDYGGVNKKVHTSPLGSQVGGIEDA